MRKPVLFALIAVIVLLAGSTALLFGKYRQSSNDYADAKSQAQATQERYGTAIDEIAAIQDSLNAIVLGDSAARLIPSDLQTEQRLRETRGDEALARISLLKAGIERTKVKIQELDASLKRSGVRVAGLRRMVANLKRTVAEKEEMVAALSTQVDSLQTQVTGLTAVVQSNQDTIAYQAATLEARRRELGTVYYAIGTRKDLQDAGLVVAHGGFLGIGRTLEPTGKFDDSHFTALDTDLQSEIVIPSKRVKVVSDQPSTSYELQSDGTHTVLRILDAHEFRTVKHVVIVTA